MIFFGCVFNEGNSVLCFCFTSVTYQPLKLIFNSLMISIGRIWVFWQSFPNISVKDKALQTNKYLPASVRFTET